MEVEVKLYAVLRRHRPQDAAGAPHHPFMITLPAGATIAALCQTLAIPDGMVNAVARNDEAVEMDALLQEGDKVSLFPPTAGG